MPNVFADKQSYGQPFVVKEDLIATFCKVAFFIKNAIIWQALFMIKTFLAATLQYRRWVKCTVIIHMWITQNDDNVFYLGKFVHGNFDTLW